MSLFPFKIHEDRGEMSLALDTQWFPFRILTRAQSSACFDSCLLALPYFITSLCYVMVRQQFQPSGLPLVLKVISISRPFPLLVPMPWLLSLLSGLQLFGHLLKQSFLEWGIAHCCLPLFVSALIAVCFNLTCFLQFQLSPWRIPAIRGLYVLFTNKLLTRIDFGTWYILISISQMNKWLKECPGPSGLTMNDCILSLDIFKLIVWSLEIMRTDIRNLWSWKFKASFERYMIYFGFFCKMCRKITGIVFTNMKVLCSWVRGDFLNFGFFFLVFF